MDQAHFWSQAAAHYEEEFVDPYLPDVDNPLVAEIETLGRPGRVVADLGCGIGPLLPQLSRCFGRVLAIDFSAGMLDRARQTCPDRANITYHQCGFLDLHTLNETVDVAVAVNSLVLPDSAELEQALQQVAGMLRPGGHLLGIVPAMDAVHYHTMLLVDQARAAGLSEAQARERTAKQADHCYHDFAFGRFLYQGLEQHFWQPFEVAYRLRRAGFCHISRKRVLLSWTQFAGGRDLVALPPPWDWFFHARKPRT